MRRILAAAAATLAAVTAAGCGSSGPAWCGYTLQVIHNQTSADGIAAAFTRHWPGHGPTAPTAFWNDAYKLSNAAIPRDCGLNGTCPPSVTFHDGVPHVPAGSTVVPAADYRHLTAALGVVHHACGG